MKFLITGANGCLGSAVVKKLQQEGVSADHIIQPRSSDYDLKNFNACQAVCDGVDVVVHCAAITGNGIFHKENPGSIFYENLIMGVQLAEAARRAGVRRYISIGSATQYPAKTQAPFKESHLWDGYPELSHAPYSMAKQMLMVQNETYKTQYGFNAVHLLPPNMYGPQSPDFYVIPSLIKKVLDAQKTNKDEIEVWGTGEATREFLYIEDAANAIWHAINHPTVSGPINIGTGEEIKIKNLVELICKSLDFAGGIRYNSSIAEDHKRRLLDVKKAEKELGWRASTSIQQGLQKTIEWFLEENAS
jgi:GDP-L-fucose synthase